MWILQTAIVLALLAGALSPLTAFVCYGLTGLALVVREIYIVLCDLNGIELKK
jgi:hypothetical protein